MQDDTEKKLEVRRNIDLAADQNGIHNCQLVHSTQGLSSCVWGQVAGVSHGPAMCSKSVLSCMFV